MEDQLRVIYLYFIFTFDEHEGTISGLQIEIQDFTRVDIEVDSTRESWWSVLFDRSFGQGRNNFCLGIIATDGPQNDCVIHF